MTRRAQKKVGVVGLGIIGQRVAENLRRRGFQVFVWNRTPRPFPNFVGSPAEIAALCDFVQIFVADDAALQEIVRQMTGTLGANNLVMAHSTVAPDSMRSAAEIVRRRGSEFVDAPFTGSKLAAEKGELIYYVGGDEMALRRARPVLEASSKEILEIGAVGDATIVKIATNMVTAVTVQVGIEALALAYGAGISPEKFGAALRCNASHSGTLGFKLPKIIEGDFEPHFSVNHMLKDLRIAARMGRALDVGLPATAAAHDRLLEEVRNERGDDDYSSVARQYFAGNLLQVDKDNGAALSEQLELRERPLKETVRDPSVAEPSEEQAVPDIPQDPSAQSSASGEASEESDSTDVTLIEPTVKSSETETAAIEESKEEGHVSSEEVAQESPSERQLPVPEEETPRGFFDRFRRLGRSAK